MAIVDGLLSAWVAYGQSADLRSTRPALRVSNVARDGQRDGQGENIMPHEGYAAHSLRGGIKSEVQFGLFTTASVDFLTHITWQTLTTLC